MAYYKVLETSFIGMALVQEGAVVDINDDPEAGGMHVGPNLAACDEDGNMLAADGAKAKTVAKGGKKAKAGAAEGNEGGDDLA